VSSVAGWRAFIAFRGKPLIPVAQYKRCVDRAADRWPERTTGPRGEGAEIRSREAFTSLDHAGLAELTRLTGPMWFLIQR
jgi:hypothetical protein